MRSKASTRWRCSAVLNSRRSTSQPFLSARCHSSMPQRRQSHCTFSQAACAVPMGKSVSSIQSRASTPSGGSGSWTQIHPRRHPGHPGQFPARTAQAMAFLAALFARRQNPATTQFAQGDFGAGERRTALGRIPGRQGAGFPSQRIARTGRLDCGQLIEMV